MENKFFLKIKPVASGMIVNPSCCMMLLVTFGLLLVPIIESGDALIVTSLLIGMTLILILIILSSQQQKKVIKNTNYIVFSDRIEIITPVTRTITYLKDVVRINMVRIKEKGDVGNIVLTLPDEIPPVSMQNIPNVHDVYDQMTIVWGEAKNNTNPLA